MLLAVAVFVGSTACQPCHPAIAEAWAKTGMARSSGRAEPLPAADFIGAGGHYRIEGRRLRFDGGESTIDYFIGSGTQGRTWLREWSGYLFELPVSWYARSRSWDVSPGYQGEPYVRLNRAIEPSCLQCHASQVRPVRGTLNRYGDPPFLEDGVGCERCHGPGGEHVRSAGQAGMVNPAKLDAERRDSICSQCHLTGEARIPKAEKRPEDFRAGERLADYATYLVRQTTRGDRETDRENELKVTSHVETLAASRCRVVSGERLWCGTCHDVHTGADRTQSACVACHPAAHRQAENCAACHLPKRPAADTRTDKTTDITTATIHGIATDHHIRIPRRGVQPKSVAQAAQGAEELTALAGSPDDRALGLAYAELGDPRARAYLLRATPQDWRVRLRLAVTEGDPARAAAGYLTVLRENPDEVSALVNLGAYYAGSGRIAEATALWERALVVNPGTEQAVLNLSRLQPAAEARKSLARYLELNPASPLARARLREIH